jgi:hypothetical protein
MEDATALRGPCPARAGIMCGAINWGGVALFMKVSWGLRDVGDVGDVGDDDSGLPWDVGDVGVDDSGLPWDELVSLYTQFRHFWRHHTQGFPSLSLKHYVTDGEGGPKVMMRNVRTFIFCLRHLPQACFVLAHLRGGGLGEGLEKPEEVATLMAISLLDQGRVLYFICTAGHFGERQHICLACCAHYSSYSMGWTISTTDRKS